VWNIFAIVGLLYGSWGRRERKRINNILIYYIYTGRGYNDMYGKLLNNG
jgi:hypothetical protein